MNHRTRAVTIALTLTLAPAATQAAEPAVNPGSITIERPREIIEDRSIVARIKTELAQDKTTSALAINVDVSKGVVRLSGAATSRAEAERAAAIARNAAGVSAVKNDIQVRR